MAKIAAAQFLDHVADLPTLPQVVINLMSAIEDPRSNAEHINRIMSNDPALATRVLKLVNSSFYSFPCKIASIHKAVVILGFATVRSLAISTAVLATFNAKNFSEEKFWRQSLAYAFIAEHLEKQTAQKSGNAFTVGLLHGIGKIILEQRFPQIFTQIIAMAKQKNSSFNEAQREFLEVPDAEIARLLLAHWKLPEILQEAIRHQYTPLQCLNSAGRSLAAIVCLTRYLYRVAAFEDATDFDLPSMPAEEIWQLLGLSSSDAEMWRQAIADKIKAANALFAELI